MSNEVPSPGITRPACRMENPADAVFCGNAHCHKALGEFPYAGRADQSSTTRLEKTADQHASTYWHFVTLHVAWFVAWIALNSGMLSFVMVFDTFPTACWG